MAIQWTEKRNGIGGSRWEVWERHFREILPWDDFKDDVAKYNPHLNRSTGWCFVPEYYYTLPHASRTPEKEDGEERDALMVAQLLDGGNLEVVLTRGSGSKGSVMALQRMLNQMGFGAQLNWETYGADGVYGASTVSAVRSFAHKNGFNADGRTVTRPIAGKLLDRVEMLDDLRNVYNALQEGNLQEFYRYRSTHRVAVVSLQTLLKALGYGEDLAWATYGADGDYGVHTVSALRAFSENEGLDGDGRTLTREQAERIVEKLKVFYGDDWVQDTGQPEKRVHRLRITETMTGGKRRVVVADDAGHTVRFTSFRKGVYVYGQQEVQHCISENREALDSSGITDPQINVMTAVSENEGNLDSINTWDNAFLSFGIFQWTLGTGSGPGELAALLKKVKHRAPELFVAYYGRHGLDIVETGSVSGYLSVNGRKLSSSSLKETLRNHEWAFYFWLSGQDPGIQAVEIEHALARIDRFYRNDDYKVKGYFISDLISSEYGVGLLLDNHVNRPGYLTGCLEAALEKTGLGDPVSWEDGEEDLLIREYLEVRKTYGKYPMTHADERAEVTRKYLETGIISGKRGSFS